MSKQNRQEPTRNNKNKHTNQIELIGKDINMQIGLSQTEDRVAEVDDAVTMGDENHRVVRKLGGQMLQQD